MTYSFAETMRQKMEAKNLDIKKLAEILGWSFEHIRKLYNSAAFPSRSLRDKIAEALEVDPAEFEKQVNADRWRERFGEIPTVSKTRHPINDVWDELTKDQQASVLCVARCLARQKKRKASDKVA